MTTLRQAVDLIEPGKRARWLLLVCLSVAVAAIEAVAMLLIFSVLTAVTHPREDLSVPLVGNLTERFPVVSRSDLFVWTSLVLGAFFLLRGALSIFQSYVQNRVAQRAGVHLATRLLRGYLALPYEFHLSRNTSESIRNATESVSTVVASVFIPIQTIASELTVSLGILVVLLVKAPLATALGIALLGIVLAATLSVVQPRVAHFGRIGQAASRDSLQVMQHSLDGIRDVRVHGVEGHFSSSFEQSRSSLARAKYLRATFSDVTRVAIETAVVLFVLGFLAMSVIRDGSTADSLAILGLFSYAVLRLLPSLNRIVGNLNSFRFGAAAVHDLHLDLAGFPPMGPLEAADSALEDTLSTGADITVEGVSYRYPGTTAWAIRNVSLRIPAGSSLGIVGVTGSGKSTLADVLLGLVTPTEGALRIGGVDCSEHTRAWQRHVGLVSQSVFLLDDSIRRNVAFGLDDSKIRDADVWDALSMAQLDGFVAGLPSQLDSLVGERGIRLSGGQRQRIAIARALYRKPSFLLFDEGTASLDKVTEAELVAAIDQLRGERTIVSIAHRLSTVRSSDEILLLRQGEVVERGTYDQLLERSNDFRRLAQ